MRLAPAALVVVAAAGWYTGCASQGMPPGGPEDKVPPTLTHVTPESGSVSVSPRTVEFRFNEVVSERPRGAQSLAQLIVISPSDGGTDVNWGRDRIVVRPSRGWRPNTAYTVTVLAGLSDLRANAATKPFTTVFSTGQTIPRAVIRGAAFDWLAGRPVAGARIEATLPGDSIFKWAIAADSTGRFALGSLPAETFLVRGWIDANNNGVRDSREPWDTATIAVRDSARQNFYAFPHDTLGARVSEVSVTDSVTIRLKFDHALQPAAPLDGATFRLIRARDSSEIAIARVESATLRDSLEKVRAAARADSAAKADTTEAGKRAREQSETRRRQAEQDSISRAQMQSVRAARDTVKHEPPLTMDRPTPPTEFVVITRDPIPEDVPLRLIAAGVRSLNGHRASSDRPLQRRKPVPRDTTNTKRPPGVPPARPPR